MTTASRVLAGLVAVLVLLRVVASSVGSLLGPTVPVVAVPTLVLLLAGLALVVTALLYAAGQPSGRRWFGSVLAGFLVVMAGYLVLGFALGAHVPWTAYAVLAGVAVLGGAALATARDRG